MATNPAGLVYGTIMIGTLLAAESANRETYPRTVAAALVAMLLYWLVHGYAQFTSERLREGRPLELARLRHAMVAEVSILTGGALPLLALVLAWIAGASLSTAVAAAVWVDATVILVIEVVAGVRAEQRGWGLVGQAALGALLGFLIIALRLILH